MLRLVLLATLLATTTVVRAEPAPPTACVTSCDGQERACSFDCGESRGCMRLCASIAVDCRAGCALGMGPEAVARMRAWIEGPLAGNDHSEVKLQLVVIERNLDDGSGVPVYDAFIKNQLGLRCGLTWSVEGRPAALKSCKPSEHQWLVTPAEIPLLCTVDAVKKREKCVGNYRRRTGAVEQEATLTLLRGLR